MSGIADMLGSLGRRKNGGETAVAAASSDEGQGSEASQDEGASSEGGDPVAAGVLAELQALRAEVQALRGEDESPPAAPVLPEIEVGDIISQADFEAAEQAGTLWEYLNTALVGAVKQAREQGRQEASQLIDTSVQREVQYHTSIETFWSDHPDLDQLTGSRRDYVGLVAARIQRENPNASTSQVLTQTAEAVRKDLGLTAQQGASNTDGEGSQEGGRSPQAFANPPSPDSDRSVPGELDSSRKGAQDQQIGEMLNHTRR